MPAYVRKPARLLVMGTKTSTAIALALVLALVLSMLSFCASSLLNGVNGTIEGTSDDGNGVAVRFPALFNVLLDIELQHVSREAPEPPSLFWIYWLLCGTISLCVVLPFMLLYFMFEVFFTYLLKYFSHICWKYFSHMF